MHHKMTFPLVARVKLVGRTADQAVLCLIVDDIGRDDNIAVDVLEQISRNKEDAQSGGQCQHTPAEQMRVAEVNPPTSKQQ